MLLMLFVYDKQEAMHIRDSGRVTVAFFWQPNKYLTSQSIHDKVKMYPVPGLG